MKNKTILVSLIILLALVLMDFTSSGNKSSKAAAKPLVTFIELGSVRCIPCKKMEPVLDHIRKKYPKDVKVVFHDVWTEAGKPYSKKFGIKLIPTQIFLDKENKEYFRHEGFFPEAEVIKILKMKGVEK